MAPRGENQQDDHDTDSGGGHRRRGGGYLCGVITTYPDIDDMTVGGVTRKGAKTGKAPWTFHVQALECQYIHTVGGLIRTNMA